MPLTGVRALPAEPSASMHLRITSCCFEHPFAHSLHCALKFTHSTAGAAAAAAAAAAVGSASGFQFENCDEGGFGPESLVPLACTPIPCLQPCFFLCCIRTLIACAPGLLLHAGELCGRL